MDAHFGRRLLKQPSEFGEILVVHVRNGPIDHPRLLPDLAITALYAERDDRRGQSSLGMRLLLIVGGALTALTANLGGLLAQGSDFFNY